MHRWFALFLLASTAIFAAPTLDAASPVFVRADGSDATCNGTANASAASAPGCAFATIAHAVTQVDANGEVQIAPGDYTSAAIVIGKNIAVRGVPGSAKPAITATSGPLFTCDSGFRCVFSEMEINGGGINNVIGIKFDLFPPSRGAVRSIEFAGFNTGQGTGVSTGGRVTIANNTFTSTHYGVAVHSAQALGTIVANNTYTGTSVFGSIGVWLFDAATATVTGNMITGATRGIHVDQSYGTFTKNTLMDNGTAITSGTGNFEAHGNRIAGNTTGISAVTSTIDAENNWWGCNEGPGNPGCDPVIGAAIDFDPWLVLSIDAPTFARAPRVVTVDLAHNSNGAAAAADSLKNGTPVDFVAAPTSTATLTRTTAPLQSGRATTRLIPAANDGNVTASATLDAETVSDTVLVDRKAPKATLTAPADGALLANLANAKGSVTDPAPGSGNTRILLAVRRELGGGSCRNWNGATWLNRPCRKRIWLPRDAAGPNWVFPLPGANPLFDVPGSYSIFVRGIDAAGNTAPAGKFTRGVNWVRFHVVP